MRRNTFIVFAAIISVLLALVANSDTYAAFAVTKATLPDFKSSIQNARNAFPEIIEHMKYFSSLSRVTGYPGFYESATYILNFFNSSGLSDVHYENYSMPIPLDKGATLDVLTPEKMTFNIHPLWPNRVALSNLPEGLAGTLIYVGDGELTDFDGHTISNSIVLMNFNTRYNWYTAVKLGASAVIFIEPELTVGEEVGSKAINSPLQFPRFYIGRSEAVKLISLLQQEVKVKIVSRMSWETIQVPNIFGYIEGKTYPNKIIVLSAYFDSGSVVPSLAPGASETPSIATLLELVEYFAKPENHPDYTMMFLALSGHHQGIAGARYFVEKYVFQDSWNIGKNFILWLHLDLNPETDYFGMLFNSAMYYFRSGDRVGTERWRPLMDFYWSTQAQIESATGNRYKISTMSGVSQLLQWGKTQPTFVPAGEYDAMVLAQGPGAGICTMYSTRPHYNSPLDTFKYIEPTLSNLYSQIEFNWAFIDRISHMSLEELNKFVPFPNGPEPLRYQLLRETGAAGGFDNITGTIATYDFATGWYTPLPNAIVLVERSLRGMRGPVLPNTPFFLPYWWDFVMLTMSNQEGKFAIPGIGKSSSTTQYITSYVVDSNGSVIYAPDFGKYKFIGAQPITLGMWGAVATQVSHDIGYLVLLKSGSIVFFDLLDPRSQHASYDFSLFLVANNFLSHQRPDRFSWDICEDRSDNGRMVSVVFSEPGVSVEFLLESNDATRYPLLTLSNASADHPMGYGYSLKAGEQIIVTNPILHYSNNLYWINHDRLLKASGGGLGIGSSKEELDSTKQLIDNSETAYLNREYSKSFAYAVEAEAKLRPLYMKLRGQVEDAVYTFPLIALLIIPFVFIAEKLFLEGRGGRRLISLMLIFALVSAYIITVHPGSTLASDVSMVIVSSVILILSIPIYGVVFGSFLDFIKSITKELLGRHELERERVSTGISSFDVGIKNMKKRRMRTGLTLVSIIIIVMGLVSFSSVEPKITITYMSGPSQAPYEGVYLQRYLWGASTLGEAGGLFGVGRNVVDYLNTSYAETASVTYRSWLYSGIEPSVTPIPMILDQGRISNVSSLLGLSWNDPLLPILELNLTGRWFGPYDSRSVILSKAKAQSLSLKIGDTVTLYGQKFPIIGLIDDNILQNIKEVNEEQITPLWFTGIQVYNMHLPPSEVAIIPTKTLDSLGGTIVSISVAFSNASYVIDASKEISKVFADYELYASSKGTTNYLRKTTVLNLLGWQVQIIPMILGSLTILNLMLAMMMERNREVSIYSSIGLSPSQVSFMFLAEVLCFATVGGLLGYFGAVATMYVSSLFKIPAMLNYASTWAVGSMGIAMAIIIASAIYPLTKVSRLVTPSLKRRWEIPTQPVGDAWNIPFPFVMETDQEAQGLMKFLREFIDIHRGERAELFAVRDSRYEEGMEDGRHIMSLVADVNISPYELGIRQEMRILAIREPSVTRRNIVVLIKRVDGPRESWIANNYYVMDSLRKQFLIWRGLPPGERIGYIEK